MRAVHAEMAALTDAALRGVFDGGRHDVCNHLPLPSLCTAHRRTAGIKRVVYLEPYVRAEQFNFIPTRLLWTKVMLGTRRFHLNLSSVSLHQNTLTCSRCFGERRTAKSLISTGPMLNNVALLSGGYTAEEKVHVGALETVIEPKRSISRSNRSSRMSDPEVLKQIS